MSKNQKMESIKTLSHNVFETNPEGGLNILCFINYDGKESPTQKKTLVMELKIHLKN